ncbi:MAG: tRNA (adenosine(37)-N6)-threonylcarbamoyltransferase complex transferase subunit TsaD [Firmicutes bacterium]|nr:tRNA (adenosine(37)-N6)-threonylcarbamoyltransferase complex transferase subunit TsaD [Bacillota bacterium]
MNDKITEKFNKLAGRNDILVLGIESSCDETAAAVVRGRRVLSDVVASQTDIHTLYGGVVPEIASRSHAVAFTGVVDRALREANVTLNDIEAIAVTSRPGLIGSLLVGVCTAKALAFAKDIPLIDINHIEAHICANYVMGMGGDGGGDNNGDNTRRTEGVAPCNSPLPTPHSPLLAPPFLSLVASGGHTSIIDVTGYNEYKTIGRTTDDAIGEAFDKVARLLGLPYPGGPNVDKLAQSGDPYAIDFIKTRGKKGYSLSYSGLKTAVANYVNQRRQKGEEYNTADVCASFTRQAVDMLLDAVFAAAEEYGRDTIAVAGGVAANSYLRRALAERAEAKGRRIVIPPINLCTDNAVMVALRGFFAAREGVGLADLSLNVESVV